MKQNDLRINGTYRLKSNVLAESVQADGKPFDSPDVTIVRVKYPNDRKTAWFFDAQGNAFRSSDFSHAVESIEVEL